MANVRVKLNMRGVAGVLSCPGVQADLKARATRVANAAESAAQGNGYEKARYYPDVEIHDRSHGIAVAHVWPNLSAAIDNNENRTLIQAFSQAG